MAEITRVSPSEMNDIAKNIGSIITEWDNAKKALYAAVAELDPMWDGAANDRFNEQWQETEPKYAKLYQVMEEYCNAITTAATNYATTEEQVVGIINN